MPLVDAVAASCAVPGVFPPIPIGDRMYIDGGLRSTANADVAAECARIVVLAPIPRSIGPIRGSQRQLDEIDVPSTVVSPDAASRAAIGYNLLDLAARRGAAEAGRAQAATVLEKVRAVWSPRAGPETRGDR